jgi:hypothetical protein
MMAGIDLIRCSKSTENSYAAILTVNGEECIWQGDMEKNECLDYKLIMKRYNKGV